MGATVFAYPVQDLERYGGVEFDRDGRAILYFHDQRVVDVARNPKPSPCDELEITDVNRHCLEWGALDVQVMGCGHSLQNIL